jgi:hypothetical protein
MTSVTYGMRKSLCKVMFDMYQEKKSEGGRHLLRTIYSLTLACSGKSSVELGLSYTNLGLQSNTF